jgi:nucleotide-binding universal stress UspA family protein
MYKSIVVGTDGSPTADRAVAAAAELAGQCGAKLHVVTAYKSGTSGMASAIGAPLVDPGVESTLRQEAASEVGQRALTSWGKGIEAEHHAVLGDAADAIVHTAESVGADLVVVGSKGMRGARRVLGSVPNSVSHSSPCAVLIVKTDG